MIELNQSVQCLFCPQRRKIAMLLKLVLAGSAAIIVGLVLFRPGTNRAQVRGNPGGLGEAGLASRPVSVEVASKVANGSRDALSQRSIELRDQARKRFLEVQAQVRSDLSRNSPNLKNAESLINVRKREVLMTKLLVLGEEAFTASTQGGAHKKLVLDFLNSELDTLDQQTELIGRLKQPN